VLESLGVGPVEERVYELLVSRGRLSLAEVIAADDVEPALQREALDALVAKGLVRLLTGHDHEFVVAPPEQAIEALIAERMSALQAVRAQTAELAARARRASQTVDPIELIEIVSGEGSVRQLFLQALKSAREEIVIFDRPPYATDVAEAASVQDEQLSSRGLRMRTVFERSLLEDPAQVRRILEGISAGEEGRVATVSLKLVIVDREWAMLPLLHAAGQTPDAAVIVRRSVLLDSLLALFESVWQQAVELKPAAGGLAVMGTAEGDLREIAHLLNLGMTDIAIAHHLGVSERTVRRRIKDLMDELRVDSRYRAGVRAAQRGWA
jgi:sugar-specific transcriptional regulator TrmB/DNA-binding CsgD family transcriptional regulator